MKKQASETPLYQCNHDPLDREGRRLIYWRRVVPLLDSGLDNSGATVVPGVVSTPVEENLV